MPQYGKYSSGNLLKGAVDTVGLFESLKESRAKRDMMKTIAAGKQQTAEGHLKVSQDQLALDKQKQEADLQETPLHERGMTGKQTESAVEQMDKSVNIVFEPLTPGDFAVMGSEVKDFEKRVKVSGLSKSLEPYKEFAMELSTVQKAPRVNVLLASRDAWDQFKRGPLEVLQKAIDKAPTQKERKQYVDIYNKFESGEILNEIFPASYAFLRKPPEKPPKNLEEAVARGASKKEALKYWREKLAKTQKGKGGMDKLPNDIKVSLALLKALGKGKMSIQDKIMAELLAQTMPGFNLSDESESDYSKNLSKVLQKKLSDYVKVNVPEQEEEKTTIPDWRKFKK